MERLLSPSQVRGSRAQWPFDKSGARRPVHLPLRGQRRLGLAVDGATLLLPVELRHVNHTASTNPHILGAKPVANPTIIRCMASPAQIDQIAERVERLLVRYEELQRTNALLAGQVEVLTQERDSLKSRLSAARSRVDALLERLPDIKNAA